MLGARIFEYVNSNSYINFMYQMALFPFPSESQG